MKNFNTYILEKLNISRDNKNIKLTPEQISRIDKIVLDIVKVYFGFIPDLLEIEGEEFNTQKEKYDLMEKMERYYSNNPKEHSEEYKDSDIDAIHYRLGKWLDDHNKMRTK